MPAHTPSSDAAQAIASVQLTWTPLPGQPGPVDIRAYDAKGIPIMLDDTTRASVLDAFYDQTQPAAKQAVRGFAMACQALEFALGKLELEGGGIVAGPDGEPLVPAAWVAGVRNLIP